MTLFVAGWNDSSAGPLIPYIQRYFGLGYGTVSTLFVGQMVGFIVAGFANSVINDRLGFGKVCARIS